MIGPSSPALRSLYNSSLISVVPVQLMTSMLSQSGGQRLHTLCHHSRSLRGKWGVSRPSMVQDPERWRAGHVLLPWWKTRKRYDLSHLIGTVPRLDQQVLDRLFNDPLLPYLVCTWQVCITSICSQNDHSSTSDEEGKEVYESDASVIAAVMSPITQLSLTCHSPVSRVFLTDYIILLPPYCSVILWFTSHKHTWSSDTRCWWCKWSVMAGVEWCASPRCMICAFWYYGQRFRTVL